MQAAIDLYQGLYTREQMEPEIWAYGKAINELEKYYFGETKTGLEITL